MPSFEEAYGQSAATASSATTTTTTTSASTLPQAAIDLASTLFTHARSGSSQTLSSYLAAGIPPNLTNSTGDTLLMLASYHGHAETAKMLLAAGADPNVLNARGQSPVAGAVFKGYEDVVAVLVAGGADVQAGQPSAVDCARMFKRQECLKMFGVEEGTREGESNGVS
ncbi:hypothetical protein ACN47E_001667 [Coniothyrium glycines]